MSGVTWSNFIIGAPRPRVAVMLLHYGVSFLIDSLSVSLFSGSFSATGTVKRLCCLCCLCWTRVVARAVIKLISLPLLLPQPLPLPLPLSDRGGLGGGVTPGQRPSLSGPIEAIVGGSPFIAHPCWGNRSLAAAGASQGCREFIHNRNCMYRHTSHAHISCMNTPYMKKI